MKIRIEERTRNRQIIHNLGFMFFLPANSCAALFYALAQFYALAIFFMYRL